MSAIVRDAGGSVGDIGGSATVEGRDGGVDVVGRCDGEVSAITAILKEELSASHPPDLARVSLCLGTCETALTAVDPIARGWPHDLAGRVSEGKRKLAAFVELAAGKVAPSMDTRVKVKTVADLVWGRLGSCFAKEVPHVQVRQVPALVTAMVTHSCCCAVALVVVGAEGVGGMWAQHLSAFTELLGERRGGKRHLDCAGVVTTTLIVAKQLAARHADHHADLNTIHMQVSEDHCWITLTEEGRREDSVEITTDNKGSRGKMVDEAAWAGWLYNGGRATVCASAVRALAALVVSLNPTVGNRPSSNGPESSELLHLQRTLLKVIWDASPERERYPGMAVALALGNESAAEVALLAREAARDAAGMTALLQPSCELQGMLESALASSHSGGGSGGTGRHWYPHSCRFLMLKRRGDLVIDEITTLASERTETGWRLYRESISTLNDAAAVLEQFRYSKTDEQLCKDITCVMDNVEDILKWRSQVSESPVGCPILFAQLLRLWQSICSYFASLGVPTAWVDTFLRCAKLFSDGARQCGAEDLSRDRGSMMMVGSTKLTLAASLWVPLRNAPLRAIFESPDPSNAVDGGAQKRRRRGL